MTIETELKFALSSRNAVRVMRHAAIERAATGPVVSGRVLSIYYDTPEFELRAAGIALRLRRRDSGWVQTAKWGGSALGGLHRRNELEVAVAQQALELDALNEPEIAAALAPERLRKRIRPVFVTDFLRSTRMLAWPGGGSVEASVDRGRIIAGHAQEPICELEMELKSGVLDVLFALVVALETEFALRPEVRSKAERGYALGGVQQSPTRARPVILERTLSIPDSAARIIASGLEHLQVNEYGMLHRSDPEYLHQMRVAVRRLRSCLSAYRRALPTDQIGALRAELAWFGRCLGPARDWDVFLTEMLPPLEESLGAAEDLRGLREHVLPLRERAQRAACAAINSRRYARMVLGLAGLAATQAWRDGERIDNGPVLPFVKRLLERRYERVLRRGRGEKARSIEQLHALRIAVKKLRYAVEFFASLYPEAKVKSFREQLTQLQDCLGTINDAGAMRRCVDQALPPPSRLGALVEGWSARAVRDERERLRVLWVAFRPQQKFW